MAATGKQGGQRKNTTSPSGEKKRSPTSSPHSGSRVEPSHVARQQRSARTKKS